MCGKQLKNNNNNNNNNKENSNEDSFRKISDSFKEMQVKYKSTQCWGAKTTRSFGEVDSS